MYGLFLVGMSCVIFKPAKARVATVTDPSDPECNCAYEPDLAKLPALETRRAKTEELISNPVIRAKVDALAKMAVGRGFRVDADKTNADGSAIIISYPLPEVQARIAGDGAFSDIYKSYEDLSRSISLQDAIALFGHENAAVRTYAAEYVADTAGELGPVYVYALFADDTEIATLDGCSGGQPTVSERVLENLFSWQSPRPRLWDTYLTHIARDERLTTGVRGSALSHLAERYPVEAISVAASISPPKDAQLKMRIIEALAVAARWRSTWTGHVREGDPDERMLEDDLLTSHNQALAHAASLALGKPMRQ